MKIDYFISHSDGSTTDEHKTLVATKKTGKPDDYLADRIFKFIDSAVNI